MRAQIGWGAAEDGGQATASREPDAVPLIPPARVRYLSEISETVRGYREDCEEQVRRAALADGLLRSLGALGEPVPATALPLPEASRGEDPAVATL